MTITEFLLARVAEEEAPTWTLEPYDCEPGCCAPAGWVGSRCHYCDGSASYGGTVEAITAIAEEHAETIHRRSQALAECAAKRAIIAFHSSEILGLCQEDGRMFPCRTLEAMLAVYSDHPDYDPAWRVDGQG